MPSVGTLNENSLHSQLKDWCFKKGDYIEYNLDGKIIDIYRPEPPLAIEIQTRNFFKMKQKLNYLLPNHKVILIYPIPYKKVVIKYDKDMKKIISKRWSPKKYKPLEVFKELIHMPNLINHNNLQLQIVMTIEEEIRCDNKKGSWRRGGLSVIDRKLIEVDKVYTINSAHDFVTQMLNSPPQPFSNKTLGKHLGISKYFAQQVTYCLKKSDAITLSHKEGNLQFFNISI